MSDLVKWGIGLGVTIAALVTLGVWVSSSGFTVSLLGQALALISAGITAVAPYILWGRMMLNNFCMPEVLTVAIWFGLLAPVVDIIISAGRWFYDSIMNSD